LENKLVIAGRKSALCINTLGAYVCFVMLEIVRIFQIWMWKFLLLAIVITSLVEAQYLRIYAKCYMYHQKSCSWDLFVEFLCDGCIVLELMG